MTEECSGPHDLDHPVVTRIVGSGPFEGLCISHANQAKKGRELTFLRTYTKGGATCEVDGCERKAERKGLCNGHEIQRRKGKEFTPIRTGRLHRTISAQGYVLVYDPEHPRAHKNGWVFEHIVVMEEMLGRSLIEAENVHHKNGVKDDNRPENLELWSRSQPSGQRVEDKVEWALDLLRLYAPEKLSADTNVET